MTALSVFAESHLVTEHDVEPPKDLAKLANTSNEQNAEALQKKQASLSNLSSYCKVPGDAKPRNSNTAINSRGR